MQDGTRGPVKNLQNGNLPSLSIGIPAHEKNPISEKTPCLRLIDRILKLRRLIRGQIRLAKRLIFIKEGTKEPKRYDESEKSGLAKKKNCILMIIPPEVEIEAFRRNLDR